MNNGVIDYRKIADAVGYYQGLGYKYIEVPWMVRPESAKITAPKEAKSFSTFMGDLVASGEQSFLDIREQLIRNTKYICVTPCFRDETFVGGFTHNWFVKAELIIVNPDAKEINFSNMLIEAINFFRKYSYNTSITVKDKETDINMNGIEVGSYGYRKLDAYDDFHWIYGTGCAEPRLTQAINLE